jgi:PAS domain S-box-containing protein
MKIYLTLLFSLIFTLSSVFANAKSDPPKLLEAYSFKDLVKMSETKRLTDPDKSFRIAQVALDKCPERKFPQERLSLLKYLGDLSVQLDNDSLALLYYRQALILAQTKRKQESVVELNMLVGDVLFNNCKNDSSQQYYFHALSVAQKLGDNNSVAEIMMRLGNTYSINGSYDVALDYFLESLSIFEKDNNTLGIARTYKNIGWLYCNLGDYDQSLSFLEKAHSIYAKIHSPLNYAELLYRLGVVNDKLKEYDLALSFFDRAGTIFDSLHDVRKAAYVERSKGRIFFRKGDIQTAISFAEHSLSEFTKYNYLWGIIETCNDLGVYYSKQHKYENAFSYLIKAYSFAKKIHSNELLKDSYQHLSELFVGKQDHKRALYYYKLYQNVNDSLNNLEKTKRMALLQSNYESGQKDKELRLKSEIIDRNNNLIRRQQFSIYAFGFATAIILLLALLLFREYRRMDKKSKQIERINFELDARVRERTSALRLTQYSIDHATDSILWINSEGGLLYVNHAVSVNLDFTKEELMRKTIMDIIPGFSYEDWKEHWEVARKEGSLAVETQFMRKTLSKYPVELIISYIIHDDIEYAFAYVHDISDRKVKEENLRKEKERAEEADKLKSAFLANMSHEIRTPMNAIIGFSDMLVQEEFDEKERKEFVDIIKNSGETLLKLIDDIIDISLIEAGQLKTKVDSISLNNCITEIYRLFQGQMERQGCTGIELRLANANFDDRIYIKADLIRFRQVLTNLIGNALKFTHAGFIEIGYEVTDSKHVKVFVRDTGIGIPKEKLGKVFERFQKLDDENRIYSGTGLGLTISKRLVEQMGGVLALESEVGIGSVFHFTIPFHQKRVVFDTVPATTSKPSIAYNWKGKSFLIVEDVESNYRYLETLLRKTEAQVHWARNGREALAFCQNICPDLILMDIQLPGKSGYEITREILDIFPSVPIIAQTAFAFNDEKQRIMDAGCLDFLTKPINSGNLYETIGKYLPS